jgi:hypothetical protein
MATPGRASPNRKSPAQPCHSWRQFLSRLQHIIRNIQRRSHASDAIASMHQLQMVVLREKSVTGSDLPIYWIADPKLLKLGK